MKRHLSLLATLLLVTNFTLAQNKVGLFIGYETVDAIESADEKAAAQWFQTTYANDGVVLTPSTIASQLEGVKTLWISIDRVGIEKGWQNLPDAFKGETTINTLKTFVQGGGNLLLTNHATQLTVALGRIDESLAPGIFGSGEGSQNEDIWGVHPVIGNVDGQVYDHTGHPIYQNMTYEPTMFAGIYCFEGAGVKGDHNCMWDLNSYGLAPNPNVVKTWEENTNSTVLGTWNHVVDYCCAGIVDFAPTTEYAGRILAVGLAAYEWDLGGGVNSKQDQLELFTKNCIAYLNEGGEEEPGKTDDPATEPMAEVAGKVGMLIGYETIDAIADDDEKAAAQWFQTAYGDNALIITPNTLGNIADVNTLWVAVDRTGIEPGAFNLPEPFCNGDVATAIANHVKAGGSLLLTNHATQLVNAIGRISYEPTIFGSGEGGENVDTWGVNANIGLANDHSGHDIFTGLAKNNTLYATHSFFPLSGAGWKEDHNCMWDMNAIADLTENPNKLADFEQKTNAVVLGTWQHVTDYCCAGLIEFEATTDYPGTVIVNGLASYEWKQNTGDNNYQVNVQYITWNSLQYLNSKSAKTITGITDVKAKTSAKSDCFNLAGQRVAQPQQGLYIIKGQKVLVK